MEKNNISYMDEYARAPKAKSFLGRIKQSITGLFKKNKQKDQEYSVIGAKDRLQNVDSKFVDMKGGTVREDVSAQIMANISGGTVCGNLKSEGLVEMNGGEIGNEVRAEEFNAKSGKAKTVKAKVIRLDDFRGKNVEGNTVTLGRGSSIEGDISAQTVIVEGQVDGTITAQEIVIKKGGKVKRVNAKGKIKQIDENGNIHEIQTGGNVYNMGEAGEINAGLTFNLGKTGRTSSDYLFSDANDNHSLSTIKTQGEVRGRIYAAQVMRDARISVRGGVNHLDLSDTSYASVQAGAKVQNLYGGKQIDVRGTVSNITPKSAKVSIYGDGRVNNFYEDGYFSKAA